MIYYYTAYTKNNEQGYYQSTALDTVHSQLHEIADKAVTRQVDTSIKLTYGAWETTIMRTDKKTDQ